MSTVLLERMPVAAAAPRSSGRLLVVDDEEPNRTLLRDPLENRGYDVEEAENGPQALRLIAQHCPDAILLDVMMPGMDGFQVCRRLKKDPQTAPIPILLVTALSARKERLLGIEAGANDFLTKPVDLQDLTLRVGNAVYTKRLFDQLQAEREKSERLLLNTLPSTIAERMRNGQTNIADHHPEVTMLVADLVSFTALAAHVSPAEIVSLLNEIFSEFDLLAEKHRLEKIKTIGDAYMVAGGIPLFRPDHAEAAAALALEMRSAMAQFNARYGTSVQIRVGINTGPVIAGVIGRRKFAYDVWGDAVNIAYRLESMGRPDSILVSDSTHDRLKDKFQFESHRTVELKGRGELDVYTLVGPVQTPQQKLLSLV
jgi:class 3 adenylate cyclase